MVGGIENKGGSMPRTRKNVLSIVATRDRAKPTTSGSIMGDVGMTMTMSSDTEKLDIFSRGSNARFPMAICA